MARQMTDYARNRTNYDLVITAGDFLRAESTTAHQESLVLDAPGDYTDPTVGVGAITYLDDENPQAFIRATAQQFMKDGMEVLSLKLGTNGVISSNAFYK